MEGGPNAQSGEPSCHQASISPQFTRPLTKPLSPKMEDTQIKDAKKRKKFSASHIILSFGNSDTARNWLMPNFI